MPYPKSTSSYPDVRQLFEQALASEKGLRLTFESPEQATFNAGRFNAFRVQDRKENARIYPADHHLHAKSPYDGLMVQVRREEKVVIIKKLDAGNFSVEPLE